MSPTVDLHLAMSDDRLDHALLLEVADALAGEGAVDLHSVDQDGNGDEAVGLNILVELVGDVLVEQDGVLGLVLDLALGPLLLLLLCSSCGRLRGFKQSATASRRPSRRSSRSGDGGVGPSISYHFVCDVLGLSTEE